jgi:hypothetical protein
MTGFQRTTWLAALAVGGLVTFSGHSLAGGVLLPGAGQELVLSCENGRDYPLRPIAISGDGDLVTAELITGRRRGVHVRLIPMGDGYRYSGRGIFFDGLRGNAVLNWGSASAVNCAVVGAL